MKNGLITLIITIISIQTCLSQNNKGAIDISERIGEFTGIVYDICFSDSGKTLVIPESNQICFYDINSKVRTKIMRDGHSKAILAIDLSVDEKLIASGGMDSIILIRNIHTGEILRKLDYHHGVITTLNFSPDRNLLATGSSDKTVVIFDLLMGKIVYKFDDFVSDITKVKFSPNGQILAVASLDHQIRLYDTKSGQIISNLVGHKNSVRNLCFNKEGTMLYSCGDDSRLIVWNIKNRTLIKKESVENFGSDWLLSVDVIQDAQVVAGMDSKIFVATNFGTYIGKIGVPVNRILFIPDKGHVLRFAVATRGKGVFLIGTLKFEFKK